MEGKKPETYDEVLEGLGKEFPDYGKPEFVALSMTPASTSCDACGKTIMKCDTYLRISWRTGVLQVCINRHECRVEKRNRQQAIADAVVLVQ
ncbi:hypothetical protein LCGC14_1847680 [marine sediment metagenome]|uniref:Uncharacterized protein n=1 Tax=marine sediment metagenome TaxID=412755 RepID=A0A0F9JAI3_9ZZZZ